MPDQKDLIGKGGGVPSSYIGLPKTGKGAHISKFQWNEIKWTRNKLVGAILAIGLPYLATIVVSWMVGAKFFVYLFIILGMLVGVIFLALGWIDRDEF